MFSNVAEIDVYVRPLKELESDSRLLVNSSELRERSAHVQIFNHGYEDNK